MWRQMQRQTTWVFFFRFVTIKICYWLWFFAVFETCIDTNERLHVWGCSEQQVAVLRQSAEFPQQDWAPLSRPLSKNTRLLCSLLLPHKFCSTFLSFFSVPLQPEYIAALSDTMLRLGLEWRRRFFFHIFVGMKRFHRYFLTSSHISL